MRKLTYLIVLLFLSLLAGSVYGQCTNCVNTDDNGENSSAIGINTEANGVASFASGTFSIANGNSSTALGMRALAHGVQSVAIGSDVHAISSTSITIGSGFDMGDELVNDVDHSIMMGVRSNLPTLFIGDAGGTDKTGQIGIGNVSNPLAKLHIRADDGEEAAVLIEPNSWEAGVYAYLHLGNMYNGVSVYKGLNTVDLSFHSEGNYIFSSGGNVGINVKNPTVALDVFGQIRLSHGAGAGHKVLYTDDETGLATWTNVANIQDEDWKTVGDNIIREDGKVIIGEGLTTPDGYKLYVADGILTDEVKVAVHTESDWRDFVFDENYKPVSLTELEEYIAKNKKLPEVPSAKEVVENGINLGEMDALLLQKIEELTLYIIAQNKKMETLEKEQQALVELINANLPK